MERIFTRGWVFVGHESRGPRARRLGHPPARSGAGHHGARPSERPRQRAGQPLLAPGHRAVLGATGATPRSFQCTYHAWTFGLDGALRAVPYPGGFDRDKAELGLDRRRAGRQLPGLRVRQPRRRRPARWPGHLGPGGADLLDRLCDLSPTGIHRPVGRMDRPPGARPTGRCGRRATTTATTSTGCTPRWSTPPDTYYEETVLGGETGNQSLAVDLGRWPRRARLPPQLPAASWPGWAPRGTRSPATATRSERRYGAERADAAAVGRPAPRPDLPQPVPGRDEPGHHRSRSAPARWCTATPPCSSAGSTSRSTGGCCASPKRPWDRPAFIVPDDAVTAERMQTAPWPAADPSWSGRRAGVDRPEPGRRREDVPARAGGWRRCLRRDHQPGFWRHYRSS